MRTHKPFTASLPPEMYDEAEERAKELGFRRSTYIQRLIQADLKRPISESAALEHVNQSPKKKTRGVKRD